MQTTGFILISSDQNFTRDFNLDQIHPTDGCVVCHVDNGVVSPVEIINWERRAIPTRSNKDDDYVKDPPCNHKAKIPKARPKDPSRLALKLAARLK